MSDYFVHNLNNDGTDGDLLGTVPDVVAARKLGVEQAADPDYPWYRSYRDGKHVETCQAYPEGFYDPDRDDVPPVPSDEDRALWPRPVDRGPWTAGRCAA